MVKIPPEVFFVVLIPSGVLHTLCLLMTDKAVPLEVMSKDMEAFTSQLIESFKSIYDKPSKKGVISPYYQKSTTTEFRIQIDQYPGLKPIIESDGRIDVTKKDMHHVMLIKGKQTMCSKPGRFHQLIMPAWEDAVTIFLY